MGEVLLLQEHRGAGDLLRTSPHLPSDGGAGGRAGGGLQEQEGRCTPLLYSLVSSKPLTAEFSLMGKKVVMTLKDNI